MADEKKTTKELTPEDRIRYAEAEEVEALRDILKARARSAAAEAEMMENLVEVDKAVGLAVMSLVGQGPLPAEDNPLPLWAAAILRKVGKVAGAKLIEKIIDYAADKLAELAGKQDAQAEEIEQAANKEAEIKGKPIVLG